VELRLREFQLGQSQHRPTGALDQVLLHPTLHAPATHQLTVPYDEIPHPPTPDPISRFPEIENWRKEPMEPSMPIGAPTPSPISQLGRPIAPMLQQTMLTPPIQQKENIIPTANSLVNSLAIPRASKAMTFMTTQPGGTVQERQRAMKAAERRVSAQLQRKSTTSGAGRNALVAMSATIAAQNKVVGDVQRSATKRKDNSNKQHQPSMRKKKKGSALVATTKQPIKATIPNCDYGCRHGGLVALMQMATSNTKYCLEVGNFFYQKSCLDCNKPIDNLFAQSKNKAVFYYCPVDYNVAELDDDNATFAAQPCKCILCIPCYFGRDTKKKAESGTATRTSSRGRVRRKPA
jgi:hypothetical protein